MNHTIKRRNPLQAMMALIVVSGVLLCWMHGITDQQTVAQESVHAPAVGLIPDAPIFPADVARQSSPREVTGHVTRAFADTRNEKNTFGADERRLQQPHTVDAIYLMPDLHPKRADHHIMT